MLIDTHAHVQFSGFKDDFEEVLSRAKEAGVLVVNVGTQYDTSKLGIEMAEKYGTYAVVGLHPVHTYSQPLDEEESHFTTREEKFDYEKYKALAQDPKVVGIGECGLDYYRLQSEDLGMKIEDIKQLQKDAFISQIRLAKELDKALVIHCRPSQGTQDAYEDILAILDQEFNSQIPFSDFRWEIHSFTGSPAIVHEFLKRGAYVGLNGIITFDKTGNMAEVIKLVPMDRIVLETDCPYLTPLPHRGKKNEPAYVLYVAQKLAEMKAMTEGEVTLQTTQNAKELYRISS